MFKFSDYFEKTASDSQIIRNTLAGLGGPPLIMGKTQKDEGVSAWKSLGTGSALGLLSGGLAVGAYKGAIEPIATNYFVNDSIDAYRQRIGTPMTAERIAELKQMLRSNIKEELFNPLNKKLLPALLIGGTLLGGGGALAGRLFSKGKND